MAASISTFIFDLGGVIVDVDFPKCARKLARLSGAGQEEILAFLNSGVHWRYNNGDLSPAEFHDALESRFHFGVSQPRFFRIWAHIFKLKRGTAALIRSLASRYQLCLLSNTDPVHFEYIRQRYRVMGLFDLFVLSYEEQVSKPEKEIYLRALARCRATPEQCVFIDDLPRNVDAARGLGINGVVFTTPAEVRALLPSAS